MLNNYLGAMTEVIFKHGGTIDEFIGDAILALFGAPEARDGDALRAVACAVEMQLAMESVNLHLREQCLPEVEMGIALNTGDVVVGNIGSERRSKYGVVGTHVNLTGRIESLTLGGQILISESTLQAVGAAVETGIRHEIKAKGFAEPVPVHEVRAVGAPFNLRMPEVAVELVRLAKPLEVEYSVLEGKVIAEVVRRGALVAVSSSAADLRCDEALPTLSNLRLVVTRSDGSGVGHQLYAKVVDRPAPPGCCALVFTSTPVELREHFEALAAGRTG
jgi:adenylate cyclase